MVALNETDLDFYLSIQDVEQLVEPGARIVPTSASEGTGIENLLDAVLEQAGWREDVGSAVITSARQRDCLSRSREALGRALSAQEMGAPFDLISMDAMDALIPLMELTGGGRPGSRDRYHLCQVLCGKIGGKPMESYDAIVIGGGHAGCEAALALARTGRSTLCLTLSPGRHCPYGL